MPASTARPDLPPVVLVHGFMGSRALLRPLARRLLTEGWPRAELVGYPSLGVDLPDIIQRVEATIDALPPETTVDLVGHSLGAVACRAYLKLYGGHARVRRFVALAGPHAGTSFYRFVPGALRQVLDPRGPWVERLAQGQEPVPTTVIRAQWDQQVLPPARASIPGVTERVIAGCGHNGLLWSRDAHDAVVNALLAPHR